MVGNPVHRNQRRVRATPRSRATPCRLRPAAASCRRAFWIRFARASATPRPSSSCLVAVSSRHSNSNRHRSHLSFRHKQWHLPLRQWRIPRRADWHTPLLIIRHRRPSIPIQCPCRSVTPSRAERSRATTADVAGNGMSTWTLRAVVTVTRFGANIVAHPPSTTPSARKGTVRPRCTCRPWRPSSSRCRGSYHAPPRG